MLKCVMKVEKEVTEIVFCKDTQALSPALCWETIQKTVCTSVWQKHLQIKFVMLLKSAEQPMLIPRLLCGVAAWHLWKLDH